MAVHRMVYTTNNRRINTSFAYSIARKACHDSKMALKMENDEKRRLGIPIVTKYKKKKYNKRVVHPLSYYWEKAIKNARYSKVEKNIKQIAFLMQLNEIIQIDRKYILILLMPS